MDHDVDREARASRRGVVTAPVVNGRHREFRPFPTSFTFTLPNVHVVNSRHKPMLMLRHFVITEPLSLTQLNP